MSWMVFLNQTLAPWKKSYDKPAAAATKLLQLCLTLCGPIDGRPTRLLCPWDFPGKSTGVGCHCLLRGLGLLVTKSTSGDKYQIYEIVGGF